MSARRCEAFLPVLSGTVEGKADGGKPEDFGLENAPVTAATPLPKAPSPPTIAPIVASVAIYQPIVLVFSFCLPRVFLTRLIVDKGDPSLDDFVLR